MKKLKPAKDKKSIYHTPIWRESKSGFAGIPITPGDKTVWLCLINRSSALDRGIIEAAKCDPSRQIDVAAGKSFKRYSANRYRINPRSPEDYDNLVKQVLNDFGTIGGVLHTWSCQAPVVNKDDKVLQSQETRTLSAMWLSKALGQVGNKKPIPVNFVTRGLIRGKGCKLCPANIALSGAVGVIQEEYPNLITRTIDLGDRKFDVRTGESLHKVLNGDRHHLKLAMKDGSWWIPTFENDDPDIYGSIDPIRELKNGGVYVITGGLGNLARKIAKDICIRVKRPTFALVSKNSLPDRTQWQSILDGDKADQKTIDQIKDLMELEQSGARVQIVVTDLAESGAVNATLDAVYKQHEAIDGVIHTSGVFEEGIIADKTERSVEGVFAARAMPAQALYNYFKSPNHNTDFVILFSSIANELPTAGQADYAASNAWLDGIAERAFSEGLPFFSISWPSWETEISSKNGIQAFSDIMSFSDTARTVVYEKHFGKRYKKHLEQRQPAANRADESRKGIEAPAEQMLSLWKRELKNNDISGDDNYFEIGGDSMHAVGLLRRIEETFDQSIPMSLLIKAPTAEQLVQAMGLDNAGIEQLPDKQLPGHIIPLRVEKNSKQTPMFCIHALDGGVMFYQGFASRLNVRRNIYGVESRCFHDETWQAEENIDAIAIKYLKDIKEVRPEGPYIFAGYSFGALIALRMAQLAKEQGDEVEGLIIYDMFNPAVRRNYSLFERAKVMWDKRSILPFGPRLGSCFERIGSMMKETAANAWEFYKYKTNRFTGEHGRHIHSRYMNKPLIMDFDPGSYKGRVLLVVTEDPGDKYDYGEIQGWRNIFKDQLTHRFVTGNHLEIFSGTHLELLVSHTDYFLRGGPKKKYDPNKIVEEKAVKEDSRFRTPQQSLAHLIE